MESFLSTRFYLFYLFFAFKEQESSSVNILFFVGEFKCDSSYQTDELKTKSGLGSFCWIVCQFFCSLIAFEFFVNWQNLQYWHQRLYYVKKIQWQNATPGGNRTQAASDSKSNTILSTLTWHVLLRRSLNFCSCTTWCLDLDDLRRINSAWLYKEPKVSVLQANVKLV